MLLVYESGEQSVKPLTFRGGIHPKDHKQTTNRIPTRDMPAPKLLYYPVVQHLGAPLKPLVAVGDEVKMGQKIADSDGYVSAPVHASVSGRVVEIAPYLASSGQEVHTIVIENDGLDTPAFEKKDLSVAQALKLSADEIVGIVHEAGLVGMGGATFPTHVKLRPSKEVNHVIINGAECEPYLTSDHRLMLESPEEIVMGLQIIMKALGVKEGSIGVESNKPDAVEALEKVAPGNIHVVPLKTKYPQGAEKQMIKAILRCEVPSGGLPADAGAVVFNVDTAAAVYRAVCLGKPLMTRIVTVSGDAVKNPQNVRVRLGTRFQEVIDFTGGLSAEPKKLISGGPMMGVTQFSPDVPVIKGTSGILALTEKEAGTLTESACIRCGKCVTACNVGLRPYLISAAVLQGEDERALSYNLSDCIECGSCAYVCPAGRHLVQHFRVGKERIKMRKQ